MKERETLDYLINTLSSENEQYRNLTIPADRDEKRRLLRGLMNVREPGPIDSEFLVMQDRLLQKEVWEKGIVTVSQIATVNEGLIKSGAVKIPFGDKLSLWQGDITRLAMDAIVNAANSQMLGCFVPGHNCIDNVIHSAAGIQLREACYALMTAQNLPEPTGTAKITSAYNLPSKYVIHTVGPIIQDGLTPDLEQDLANCYRSCLEIAVENQVRTLAFCCISTGVFHFPNQRAAEIAMGAVMNFLKTHEDQFDRIIFNVFLEVDFKIYAHLFNGFSQKSCLD
ncbi:MAG: protein-ADP-ribose hydrolase [Acetobacterium sp.]|nr:protein-ADP-ribose hydrolase [Bacillota bacterium]MCG2731083.1 protein-ADP-ribose hydrolase [Acetobacterium sp.]